MANNADCPTDAHPWPDASYRTFGRFGLFARARNVLAVLLGNLRLFGVARVKQEPQAERN
jgi:hypothetical protein